MDALRIHGLFVCAWRRTASEDTHSFHDKNAILFSNSTIYNCK